MKFSGYPEPLSRLKHAAIGAGTTLVVEERDTDLSCASSLVPILRAFGFSHPEAHLYPISRPDAVALIAHLVAYSPVNGHPRRTFEIADSCAEQFVALFLLDAIFFTNSTEPFLQTKSWDPLTDSTFDSGIVAVSKSRIGAIWFEDED
jgi:hypothetical protein